MKTPLLLVLAAVIYLGLPAASAAQEISEETLERTARFSGATGTSGELAIFNIHGSVTVTAYDGEEIRVTALRRIRGTPDQVALGEQELELRVEERENQNRVLVWIDAPWINWKEKNGHINYNIRRDEDDHYRFTHDITVHVPRNADIRASSINGGTVSVTGTRGRVTATHVNGAVNLQDITGVTRATTVNGKITARYAGTPAEDSEFRTVNGTISTWFPASLSAEVTFSSMHGELYTDFENIQHLQARVDTGSRSGRSGTRYRIDRTSPIQIGGSGGPELKFQVLNGDVYVRKNSN